MHIASYKNLVNAMESIVSANADINIKDDVSITSKVDGEGIHSVLLCVTLVGDDSSDISCKAKKQRDDQIPHKRS